MVRATLDDWRVDACPHHGPALAAAAALPVALQAKMPLMPADTARNAINTVVSFTEDTWVGLLANGPRPAAYVFTTPYIVLLGAPGSVQRSMGPAPADMLKTWLA